MNPEDIRKLIGGYATGSLTEAERKLLFEAVLQDQDLFDELAGEQALKEILDQPGARQRLLNGLRPKPAPAWWAKPWPWATASVTLAIAIVIVVSNRTPPPQQIAQILRSAEPVEAPAPPPAAPTVAPPVRPKAPPPPAEKSVDAVAAQAPEAVQAPEEARADAEQAKPRAQQQVVGAVSEFAAGGTRAENLMAAKVASVFAFTYTVQADGFLQIIPSAPGFLSVTANDMVIFPSSPMRAGNPVRVQIPADAASLVIGFSAMQGITGSPVRRDQNSGTVMDQDPPNRRILIQLFLTPATR